MLEDVLMVLEDVLLVLDEIFLVLDETFLVLDVLLDGFKPLKTHLQACCTAGTFRLGIGESCRGLNRAINQHRKPKVKIRDLTKN